MGWLDKVSKTGRLSKRYAVVRPGYFSWFYSKPSDFLELVENQCIIQFII